MLQARWERYVAGQSFEHFIEFAVAVNCLTEQFNRMRLPGLVRLCEGLESLTLARLGTPVSHPLICDDMTALQRQVDSLMGAVSTSRPASNDHGAKKRAHDVLVSDWIKPRTVWLVVGSAGQEMVEALRNQLNFFGFQTALIAWGESLPEGEAPLAILFIPSPDLPGNAERAYISGVRASCGASQLMYLGAHSQIESIVVLMRSGIDLMIPVEDGSSTLLNCVLDLVQSVESEKCRVLVVEDSRVAGALIQRTLAGNGIDSRAIRDPSTLFDALESYRPDLILMDMHMPGFTGVEATRVLRQMPAYSALPIVYLSGESDVGMQVEALRLGGDQFLSKPFNPVLLAAVVKTKIARYRETLRATQLDGLTGLLNHTAAKGRLKAMAGQLAGGSALTVAMIDIDHFKAVNDTYGHPVGDHVIRGLAWLLKGQLRASDMIGRYGGEEFLVALPKVSPEQAKVVIDRIREGFASLPHVHSTGAVFATFSAGVASFPMYDTAQRLIEAADNALLEAKRQGRNCVITAP